MSTRLTFSSAPKVRLLVCLLLFMGACQDPKADLFMDSKPPETLIPEDTFRQLLYKIYLKESTISNAQINQDTAQFYFNTFFLELVKEKGYDSAVFMSNFEYYSRRPTTMQRIHESITDSLRLLHDRVEMRQEAED